MARNKHNTRPYKKRGLIPRFHLPTRIMTSSRLNPSSLLRPHSPVPSPPLTPAPEPKEDRILFLPQPPYSIIDNPHFHHDVSKSITSYMVRYLDRPQEENFIKAYYQLSPFTITPTNIFTNYSKEHAAWWYVGRRAAARAAEKLAGYVCYAQALGVVDIGSLSVELSWRIRVRSGRPSCRASRGQNHGVWRGYRGSGEVRQSA